MSQLGNDETRRKYLEIILFKLTILQNPCELFYLNIRLFLEV